MFFSTGNIENTDDIEILEESQTSNLELNESDGMSEIPSDGMSKDSNVPQKKKTKNQIQEFQKALLDFMQNSPIAPPVEIDYDKYFLDSFLPDLKKMNCNQKLELKIMFAQCVKKILTPSSFTYSAVQSHDPYLNNSVSFVNPNKPNTHARHPSHLFLPNFLTVFPKNTYLSYSSSNPNSMGLNQNEDLNTDLDISNL